MSFCSVTTYRIHDSVSRRTLAHSTATLLGADELVLRFGIMRPVSSITGPLFERYVLAIREQNSKESRN